MTEKMAAHLKRLHEKQKKGTYKFSSTLRQERESEKNMAVKMLAENFLDKIPLGKLHAIKESEIDD